MTPERFRELTQIYGAGPRRWPAAEREAALAYRRDHAAGADAVLAEASALDQMLGQHRVLPPGADLRERVVAAASRAMAMRRQARLWWQGAGFAGLGLAGALAGALLVSVILPIEIQDSDEDGAYAVTAFSEISFELDE